MALVGQCEAASIQMDPGKSIHIAMYRVPASEAEGKHLCYGQVCGGKSIVLTWFDCSAVGSGSVIIARRGVSRICARFC